MNAALGIKNLSVMPEVGNDPVEYGTVACVSSEVFEKGPWDKL